LSLRQHLSVSHNHNSATSPGLGLVDNGTNTSAAPDASQQIATIRSCCCRADLSGYESERLTGVSTCRGVIAYGAGVIAYGVRGSGVIDYGVAPALTVSVINGLVARVSA
jgi:hypothetical protein